MKIEFTLVGELRPYPNNARTHSKRQIRQIMAIMERVPYGMNSGWSTWEQGLSSQMRDVTTNR